jgi:multidrug efflux system outer membrane protein
MFKTAIKLSEMRRPLKITKQVVMTRRIFLATGDTIPIKHRCVAPFNGNRKLSKAVLFHLSPFRILRLFIAFTLFGCSVPKNYQQPVLELPKQFNNVTTSDSSIASVEWKQFFTDTALQRLIENALIGNFDLQLAAKRISEAALYVKQAKMNYAPTVQLQLSAATNFPSRNSLNGISLKSFLGTNHVEDYSLNTNISWEADVWGKIKGQKEAAQAQYLQSYEAARAVQTVLIADIASSYFNLLMLDAQLEITRKNITLSDTIVLMMGLQKRAGQVTELAVQQAEVQRQKATLLLPQLEEQVAIEENTIRILSGELPAPVTRTAQLNAVPMWNELPTGLPAAMISRRPDVRAAEMALIGANANVGIAQASMYPSLNITAAGGLNAFKAAQWFVIPTSLFATAAGSVVQPVLQHRQLKTRFQVAEVQKEEAEIAFRKSALNAIGEVVTVLVRLDKLETQKSIATQQVDTLQRAVHNARLLFRSGLADYLEVITAQSNALDAELSLAEIKRNQLGATVELYRSLGGGLR